MDLQQIIREVVPGSIWLRTDGSKARVLAVTNLSLPSDRQEKYVPVVVYAGPSGNVFSRPLRDFAGYFPTWIGFDQAAEASLEKLTMPLVPTARVEAQDNSGSDVIDMSDVPEVPARTKPSVQVRAKAEVPPKKAPSLIRSAFSIGKDEQAKTPDVTASQLSDALRVYSQVPDEHLHLVVHKLSFELSPSLTMEQLKEVFCPDSWVNTVDMFRIGTPVSDQTIGVDAYIGVYPEFSRNVLYGTVYIGTDMEPIPVEEANEPPAQVDEPPAAQTPENGSAEPVGPQVEAETNEAPPDQVSPESVEPEPQNTPPDQSTDAEPVERAESIPSEHPPEISETPTDAPAPAKKPRKKREPKKKAITPPAIPEDDDLDVANLS